ncbi:hypothetical protein ATY76_21430 [Rhizobium sp. R339]|nr:hypothetical protein ATY76_21430 [Rhizobium sp. R339]
MPEPRKHARRRQFARQTPLLHTDRDRTYDNLGATALFDMRLHSRRIDNHRCELQWVFGCGQHQLALPGHCSPGGQMVRL